jgi:hypothetical protein
MREAFVEIFGDEIAAGVVKAKLCPNWAGNKTHEDGTA